VPYTKHYCWIATLSGPSSPPNTRSRAANDPRLSTAYQPVLLDTPPNTPANTPPYTKPCCPSAPPSGPHHQAPPSYPLLCSQAASNLVGLPALLLSTVDTHGLLLTGEGGGGKGGRGGVSEWFEWMVCVHA